MPRPWRLTYVPTNLTKKLLQYASKTGFALVLATITFSPFFQVLTIPSAHAQQIGTASGTPPTSKTPAGQDTGDGLKCEISDMSNCLANIVYVFTVGLGSGLAYVGGFIFDMTVSLSLNSSAYALDFLSSGWGTARDLANMGFILILVYIAFMIMFQAETPGTIRLLAGVIFIALIINFSFFLTRVVIDAGNILAVQFYNAIDAPTMLSTVSETSANTGTLANAAAGIASKLSPNGVFEHTKDLTAGIMKTLSIEELFADKNFQQFAKASGFGTKFIILSFLYIMVGACYFILAAMFLAVGIKFLVRIVVLWFLIIAAPLAFIAKAVPKDSVSSWYDRWQHELISHTFYPAAFLFIFLFINTVMTGLGTKNGILAGLATDLNNSANNLNGFTFIASQVANVGIRLGFVVAMLYIALKASEYIGVQGAGVAHTVTGWAGRAGTSAAFGSAGALARNTFGAGGYALSQSSAIRAGAQYAPGRLLQSALTGIGKSSFDMRAAPGVRTGLGKLGIDTAEAGGKDGYAGAVATRTALREKQARALKPSDYELDQAYKNALGGLSSGDKDALAKAAKEYADAQEDHKNGEATTEEVKAKKKAYSEIINRTEVIKKAKKLAGGDYSKEFIGKMDKLSWQNMGGIGSSGIPGLISRGDKEAAAKMRDSKDDKTRILNLIKNLGGSGETSSHPAPLTTIPNPSQAQNPASSASTTIPTDKTKDQPKTQPSQSTPHDSQTKNLAEQVGKLIETMGEMPAKLEESLKPIAQLNKNLTNFRDKKNPIRDVIKKTRNGKPAENK
ncbi:MAG: hypothetical protein JWL87_606 [Candidatus Adlerbacteria bacterium]|nr:hypothetical protein [Candidatus Adlerbacteria bacterium]